MSFDWNVGDMMFIDSEDAVIWMYADSSHKWKRIPHGALVLCLHQNNNNHNEILVFNEHEVGWISTLYLTSVNSIRLNKSP